MAQGIMQATHALRLLTIKKTELEAAYAMIDSHRHELETSKKQTEEMEKEMRTWKNKHNEIKFQQTERDAAHKATAHATFSKYRGEWFTEKKTILEREGVAKMAADSSKAQLDQLRQVRREDWKCDSCDKKAKADDRDWVKAIEKLRENHEKEIELLQRRIASLESDQDIAIEAHPLHQQIKSALLAKFKEIFAMQEQAKTIKTQMDRLAEIYRRTKEEWETKTKALEEELTATKLQHKEENEESIAHHEKRSGCEENAAATEDEAVTDDPEDLSQNMENWSYDERFGRTLPEGGQLKGEVF